MDAHTDGMLICPDCGPSSYLLVDGKEMTRYELCRLRLAPRSIEMRLPHARWCPSEANRLATWAQRLAV